MARAVGDRPSGDAADQLTKHIVVGSLALDDGIHIVGPFWIHHVQNSGIAFGLFSSATPVVIVLTAIAVAWMLVFFARSGARHPVLPVSLGLVIGGSVSNLLDRVRLGYVTDFIDFRYWPRVQPRRQLHRRRRRDPLSTLLAAEGPPRRRSTRLRVPESAAGERLDRFLAALPEIGSRAVAERLVRGGGVLVDGSPRPKS